MLLLIGGVRNTCAVSALLACSFRFLLRRCGQPALPHSAMPLTLLYLPAATHSDACKAVKGCVPYGAPSNRICYPSWFIEEMNEQQMSAFIDGVLSLDPAYIGDCSSACWLRQVRCPAEILVCLTVIVRDQLPALQHFVWL
jgi:hypothetical protein